jgi:hypothetical protein
MEDLSREIIYFAAAQEPVPPTGVDLKVNLLAEQPVGAAT